MMKITGTTKLGMVIGSPITGSLSPIIHNAAIEHLNLNAIFTAFALKENNFISFLKAVEDLNLFGISVTMPLKQVAAESLQTTEIARRLNAVNAIYKRDGNLIGDNTDGQGFIKAMKAKYDFDPKDKTIFLYGAGGAARAIALALTLSGSKNIFIFNRSKEKINNINNISQACIGVENLQRAESVDLIVNCTSLGMANTENSDIDPFKSVDFNDSQLIFDIVTTPVETPLIKHAKDQGAKTVEGYYMLIFQAVLAFEHFSGVPAPTEIMISALEEHFGA
jgi:shikimate dehydrogenase